MTGRIPIEFPIEEAEAIAKRCREESMSAAECDAVTAGRARLEQAIKVERGTGGSAEPSPTMKERAEALLGEQVVVHSLKGRRHGTLDSIRETSTIGVRHAGAVSYLALELVTEIEPVQEAVAA